MVLKLKKDGALEWEKTYGGSGDDEGSSIVSANDVGYVFASFSNSTDGQVNGSDFYYNAWIVHINDTGQILWSNFYDSATSIYPSVIKSLRDSGYIIAGDNESYHSAWLLNLKNDGNVNWQKNYTGQNESYAKDVITTNDSGFMFVGCTGAGAGNNSDNYGDLWVVKLDEKGNKKWQKTYGGSLKDEGCGIAPSFDGEYVISGDTKSDNGDVLNINGGYDMWVLKINYSVLNGIDESEMADVLISLYPNPTNSKLYFQIKDNAPTNHPPTPFKGGLTQAHATITEINGRILLTQPIITTESTIDVSTLPSGIYLLRYQDADRVWNGKFIKQ